MNSVVRLPHKLSKSWKARLSAYTELIDHFKKSASDDDPIFKPWLSDVELLKKFVTDTNAAAQDKGIEALTELLKQSGQNAARSVSTYPRTRKTNYHSLASLVNFLNQRLRKASTLQGQQQS